MLYSSSTLSPRATRSSVRTEPKARAFKEGLEKSRVARAYFFGEANQDCKRRPTEARLMIFSAGRMTVHLY